jgi:hypothetical protein
MFDSNKKNRLLAAAWAVRKRHFYCLEQLEFYCKFDEEELKIIDECIIEQRYSHDEFLKIIDDLIAVA